MEVRAGSLEYKYSCQGLLKAVGMKVESELNRYSVRPNGLKLVMNFRINKLRKVLIFKSKIKLQSSNLITID